MNRQKESARTVDASSETLGRRVRERLRAVRSASERQTLISLGRELRRLPADRARAVLEASAALAGVSLRASRELLRVAPEAARTLDADELRAWGELARRLTFFEIETGINFIARGVGDLEELARDARLLMFEVCARQLNLSSSTALETFRRAPEIQRAAAQTQSDDARMKRVAAALLESIYSVALIIAQRSAKHSADFLNATPSALARLAAIDNAKTSADDGRAAEIDDDKNIASHQAPFNDEKITSHQTSARESLSASALRLAELVALRAGGIAADLWSLLPATLEDLTDESALKLFQATEEFLARGGASALHVFASGGEALRRAPEVFDDWLALLRAVGDKNNHGSATLVALARTSPQIFRALAARQGAGETLRRVIVAARAVAAVDAEAAISCFRSGAVALGALNDSKRDAIARRAVSVEAFERWARSGLKIESDDARARRSYFALETRRSLDELRGVSSNREQAAELSLDAVAQTLRLYVEGLTGRAVEIAPLAVVPQEQKINDGRTIHLPSVVSEFASEELNFKLYKTLAAHAAGQIEFGTRTPNDGSSEAVSLRAAYEAIAETYAPENVAALDAFSLAGYIEPVHEGEQALTPEEEARRREAGRKKMPRGADYRAALALFPQAGLAARIFSTLENGRVDRRLRHAYKGLARDLDFIQKHLRERRPRIAALPVTVVPFEILFQITLCGGAREDARAFYGQITSELESIVADYLSSAQSTVADTLMATSRVYSLFQSVTPQQNVADEETNDEEGGEDEQNAESGDDAQAENAAQESERQRQTRRERIQDARDLFNAWSQPQPDDAEPDELYSAERWSYYESPEQELEPGDVVFNYDEWDRELSDSRVGWCRVIEKKVRRGDRSFVELARSRHKGVISSIRRQFQLMKPESLTRIKNELDGDDYDLEAVIDYVTDRRADGQQSERLYVKRLRRERDVAVAFLLDQSSSTARTIGRNPLQPYTNPGRRIIDVEKEGLVLMSEALEAVGDRYAIYGFSSEGRRNVKFYVVKNFEERYSTETERRIGGITYHHNTRLGAAVRHAAARLAAQDARTKLLIVVSDGRPYDHDYGDARYAREDTREALRSARLDGITPFCVTIDRDSEMELRDLYGDVGYTIIDDVLSLPERMPAIYRRLTT